MLVGVISDTHSYMDVRALRLLQGVDHILHAGDIGDTRIIEELQGIAPVTAVRGNVDREPPASLYPAEETLELENYRIFPDPRGKTTQTGNRFGSGRVPSGRSGRGGLRTQSYRLPATLGRHSIFQPWGRGKAPF